MSGAGADIDALRSRCAELEAEIAELRSEYRALFEAIGEGIVVIEFVDGPNGPNSDYVHIEANQAFAVQTDFARALGRSARDLFPDEAEFWIDLYRGVLETGTAVRTETLFQATGRLFAISAFRMEPASRRRVVVLARDVTDQRGNEAELQALTTHLDALVRSSSEVRYEISADWSELAELAGGGFIANTAAVDRNWIETYVPEADRASVRAEIERALSARDVYSLEHRVNRVDGTIGWAKSRAVPVLDAHGAISSWIGSASDITDRKNAEENLRVANHELAHRMKNVLAMVDAIAVQTLRTAASIPDARRDISSRLSALGRAQDILTAGARDQTDIGDIVRVALGPHLGGHGRVGVDGPAYDLDAQRALGLSLAIHELATNAAKYGALSRQDGTVAISWRTAGGFAFRWAEHGGPPVAPPQRRGFGSRLVEDVVAGYFGGKAAIDFRPGGIVFELVGGSATAG